jgi:hypothetical protein
MTTTVADIEAARPDVARSLPARIVGVLFSPRAADAGIAAYPRWLGVLVAVVAALAGGTLLFLSTAVGREAWLDAAVLQQESFGRTVSDAQYRRLEQAAPDAAPLIAAAEIVALPIASAVIAGGVLAVFNAGFGGDAGFRQVFAIVAHSEVILALSQLLNLPLAYARQTMTSAATLGAFAAFLDQSSFAARFLGVVDLFIVWWIVSLAIGLGVLYRRRTAPIAATLIVIYLALGGTIAAVKTALSGA